MKLLYISEIVAKCGIWSVKTCMPLLRSKYTPDYIIANANSATGAGGISQQHAGYLRKLGVNCIILGDNAFLNTQIYESKGINYCVRPINISDKVTGIGYKIFYSKQNNNIDKVGCKKKPLLVVISLLGQYGRHRILANEPFNALDFVLQKIEACTVIIDYASFSTAEKQSLKYYADGNVSAIIGSGMKVATSDAQISDNGTAYISDAGRTGAFFSIGGYEPQNKIREYKTGLTEYSTSCWEQPQVQGIFLETNEKHKAVKFKRVLVKDYGSKSNCTRN